nr:uncharacterized protein LOC112778292 [Arachis hypogaea]
MAHFQWQLRGCGCFVAVSAYEDRLALFSMSGIGNDIVDETGRSLLEDFFFTSANDDHEGQIEATMWWTVTNLTLAKENQTSFEEYLSNNPNVDPGIDLTVTVLTNGFWPSYKSFDLNLPTKMIKIKCQPLLPVSLPVSKKLELDISLHFYLSFLTNLKLFSLCGLPITPFTRFNRKKLILLASAFFWPQYINEILSFVNEKIIFNRYWPAKATDQELNKEISERIDSNKAKDRKSVDRSSCGSNTTSSSELETDALEKDEQGKEVPEIADANNLAIESSNRRSRSVSNLTDSWKEVSEEGRLAFQALFAREVLPQSFSPLPDLLNKDQEMDSIRDNKQTIDIKDEGQESKKCSSIF